MRLLAEDELAFNAYQLLTPHISAASKLITKHFSTIDSALDKGKSVKRAVQGDDIDRVLRRLLASSRLTGFQLAAKHSGKQMPALYGKVIHKAAFKRAGKVNRWMGKTTKRTLRNTPDSDYVLSADRALTAARYEATKQFYRGVMDGFSGTGARKGWLTTSNDPCDDCSDNEDQGMIPIDEVFASGHTFPAAHLHCGCYTVIKV